MTLVWVQTCGFSLVAGMVRFVAGMVWAQTGGFSLPDDVSSKKVTFSKKRSVIFSIILLETLQVNSREIFHIHGNFSITAVFAGACHWFLSWTRRMQSTPSHSASFTSVLILSFEAIHVIWKYISKNKGFNYWETIKNVKPTANSLILVSVGVISDYVGRSNCKVS